MVHAHVRARMFEAARQILHESAPGIPRLAIDILVNRLEKGESPTDDTLREDFMIQCARGANVDTIEVSGRSPRIMHQGSRLFDCVFQ